MSDKFPYNNVELMPVEPDEPEDKDKSTLVRGAFYENEDGDVYHAIAIGTGPGTVDYRLASLADGNRWRDDDRLNLNDFTRLESGRVITITLE
ncbi:MAG: hypothetical protein V3S55_10010 [Nitrospiraceae bacterium]